MMAHVRRTYHAEVEKFNTKLTRVRASLTAWAATDRLAGVSSPVDEQHLPQPISPADRKNRAFVPPDIGITKCARVMSSLADRWRRFRSLREEIEHACPQWATGHMDLLESRRDELVQQVHACDRAQQGNVDGEYQSLGDALGSNGYIQSKLFLRHWPDSMLVPADLTVTIPDAAEGLSVNCLLRAYSARLRRAVLHLEVSIRQGHAVLGSLVDTEQLAPLLAPQPAPTGAPSTIDQLFVLSETALTDDSMSDDDDENDDNEDAEVYEDDAVN